ncbi:hypothetical protein [Primorskyibacter flagellatus]|uniref:Uncharacterized protein n=1 Tax=Primorskyibacter flagellatus TaxID=1387277 RepID=A0A1W2DUR8_9RHOB|nr:hypothetical protein [Primorskyibacter flagellatus]SMD01285.1 hypothetical protein SAMN06295998_11844 [Primorskyibacter flagellatus]
MDILVSNVYLCRMFARFITMLAIFALTVIATVASAHAARMSVVPDQAMHVGEMTYTSGNNELSCDGEQHCGSADAGMCDVVCTSLSAFLTSPGEQAAHEYGPVTHDIPSGVIHASRAPGLDERPPKLRLL